jgi:alkaline phosphatase/streptomycin-6-phosphatase
MRWSVVTVAAAVFVLGGVSGCATARGRTTAASRGAAAEGAGTGAARNVILLIGDGLGDSEITIARNYHAGAAGRLALDRLPVTGTLTTYTVQEADPTRPDYVGDSAATATAWATGHKTSNQRLATAPGSGTVLPTILELAQAGGLATGSVTTAELTDATPAALAAHVNHRSCQGPANMAACPAFRTSAGGLGSIAEQTVNHRIDVLLGGGRQRFAQTIDGGRFAGQTVVQSAIAQGYTVVSDATELDALASQGATVPRRVLGLFTPGNMTLEWTGQPAAPFPGSGPQRCTEGRRPPGEPELATIARAALALLNRSDRTDTSSPGFFLQIEGASIDKRNHAADPCGQIGETIAFDAAVAVALDYAARHPDTLVIVTGDHAHSSQIIPAPEPADHSPGVFSTLLTADGVPMTVAYATNLPGRSQEHTGTQIRVAAHGPGAALLAGVHDQTDLFRVMATALGLAPAASE